MKRLIAILIIIFAQNSFSQNAGKPGTFARIGYSARGMGMGNALVAVNSGNIYSYYNPALSSFSKGRLVSVSYAFLSLDRSFSTLSYSQPVEPTAGISASIMRAGVDNIDGRNSSGMHTEDYSTYDYQFGLAFSNRVSEEVSLGVGVKLYHNKLFEEVTSTTVGFDIGAHIHIIEHLSAGIFLQDIGSKYIWDTKPIYPEPIGKQTTDKFPVLRHVGLSYFINNPDIIFAFDFENSTDGTNLLRAGLEYSPLEYFQVRCGIDRVELDSQKTGAKPAFGFSVMKPVAGFVPSLTYAFIIEPYAPRGIHIITFSSNL